MLSRGWWYEYYVTSNCRTAIKYKGRSLETQCDLLILFTVYWDAPRVLLWQEWWPWPYNNRLHLVCCDVWQRQEVWNCCILFAVLIEAFREKTYFLWIFIAAIRFSIAYQQCYFWLNEYRDYEELLVFQYSISPVLYQLSMFSSPEQGANLFSSNTANWKIVWRLLSLVVKPFGNEKI